MPLNTGVYSNNETQIYHILDQNGFSLSQICGILANIEAESGFNPSAYNSGEGAYGLCQWRSGRKTDMFSKYTSSPSLYSQINFISDELKSTESAANVYLSSVANNSSGAYDAGLYFADKYERCASVHDIPRAERALEYWEYYNSVGVSTDIIPAESLEFSDSTDITNISTSTSSYGSIQNVSEYSAYILDNLARATLTGHEYGYLIDMDHGGEFKFYIPEFQETAGTNWQDIEIPGRSVSIKSYRSTNSRSITINLDLFAGAGLYITDSDSGDDVVAKLHDDANFIKSLEYPDYTNAITRPPATVHLILGGAIDMVGVVSGVTVEHLKPLDLLNRAMYLKVSFTVTQNVLDPPGWSDIQDGITALNTSVGRPERFYIPIAGNVSGKGGMPSSVPGGGTYYLY